MKLTKLCLFIFLAFFMAFQSCKTTQNNGLSNSALEGRWILKSMDGQSATSLFTNKVPTLNFDFEKKSISGNGGCNSYGGNFSITKNKLTISNIISTMMACAGAEKEGAFFQTLSKTSEILTENDELIFRQDGKAALVFVKAKPVTAYDLSGEWTLEVLEGSTANVYFKRIIPTINFNTGNMRISGNAGCNNYNASFEINNGKLEIGMMVTTRMACSDAMEGEQKFTRLLPGSSDIEIEGNRLTLKRDGVHVATFSRIAK